MKVFSKTTAGMAAAAILACGMFASAAQASIRVNTAAPAKPVSPIFIGSQIPVLGMGMGALENELGDRLKQPVRYNSFMIDKMREMKLSTLRFGTENIYNFRDGIGPYQERPGRVENVYSDTVYKKDFGTDEFMALCKQVGAEPVFVAPTLSVYKYAKNAPIGDQLAANWVEYVNGVSPGLAHGQQMGWRPTTYKNLPTGLPFWVWGKDYKVGDRVNKYNCIFVCKKAHKADYDNMPGRDVVKDANWTYIPAEEVADPGRSWLSTQVAPKGYFAWLREYFGRPEPYGVKYWEIGNEYYAINDRKVPMTNEEYADAALKIIRKMKAVDPSIKCGLNFLGPEAESGTAWQMQAVLGKPGEFTDVYNACDFIIFHPYFKPKQLTGNAEVDYDTIFQGIKNYEAATIRLMTGYNKPLMFTECNFQFGLYGADPTLVPHIHRLKSALAYANFINASARMGVLAIHHIYFGDFVWFNTKNSAFRMVFEDIDDTGKTRRGVTPTYLMLKLYNLYGKGELLQTVTTDKPMLDAQAFRDPLTGRLRLFVTNRSPSENIASAINIGSFQPGENAAVFTLTSTQGMEADNMTDTNNVSINLSQTPVGSSDFSYVFPKHSLTVLDIPLATNSGGLHVTTTANKTTVKVGDTVTYTTTCINQGTTVIASSQVSCIIPASTEYMEGSASPANGVYSAATGKVTWTVTNLQPSETRTFRCSVKIR